MNDSRKFDPPEAVLAPAFKELLERLSRARQNGVGDTDITEEERKVVEYGVTERKRVLEHTLFLVFAQWAIYRQFISSAKSRQLRIAYGMFSASATMYFLRNRAMRVSHEMFANMATTSTTSPLGNEARIILAELEGPSGPYFRRICQEKGFSEDLETVINSLDAEDGVDPASDNLHPQLRLRPRLLPDATTHPAIVTRGKESRERKDLRGGRGRLAESNSGLGTKITAIEKNPGVYTRESEWQNDPELEFNLPTQDVWETNPFEEVSRKKRTQRARERERERSAAGEEKADDDLWGKPFDFSQSTKWDLDNSDQGGDADAKEQDGSDQTSGAENNMTPGQRRAAERRRRRMMAQKNRDRDSDAS